MFKDFNRRMLLIGFGSSVIIAAMAPFLVLKFGILPDLTAGGVFIGAALLMKRYQNRELAVQLNILQTMIGTVAGIGFMCVILAAFDMLKAEHPELNIVFDPSWLQVAVWLTVSAALGVFASALWRKSVLDDVTLPWPAAKATLGVIEPLSNTKEGETNILRRTTLLVGTALGGFTCFLRDGLGVITDMVSAAGAKVGLGFSLDLSGVGMGMFLSLAVGLSGLIGVWFIQSFGDQVSLFSALVGSKSEDWQVCVWLTKDYANATTFQQIHTIDFIQNNCAQAAMWLNHPSSVPSKILLDTNDIIGWLWAHSASYVETIASGFKTHMKFMIQWMMWPATAMMIASSLTNVSVSLVRSFRTKKEKTTNQNDHENEHIPVLWMIVGIFACTGLLAWLLNSWFQMPWYETLLAISIQPLLIIAGLRVLGLTGNGPVSLMANATQGLFGLIFPNQIQHNLQAAHIAADPQSSAENSISSFWIARHIGGRFTTLVLAQLIAIPIGALLLLPIYNLLSAHYGIGQGEGQLAAPTAVKISALAYVMKEGLSALPKYALPTTYFAICIGIFLELLCMVRKINKDGTTSQRFAWMPVPAAIGFAMILPPTLTIAMAVGSVIAAVWKKYSKEDKGSYKLLATPLAAGFVAGEAITGGLAIPLLALLSKFLRSLFGG